MKIEDAIKQKKYSSLQLKVMLNIIYTSNWLLDRQNQVFKKHGLLAQHYNVLRILRGAHPQPLSPSDIKEVMLDKCNDLTRLVDKLERNELVDRKISPLNRRKVDVLITEKGLQLLSTLDMVIDKETDLIKNKLNDVEAEFVNNILDKIREMDN